MERVRYEFVLEAQTPIAHHAENIGNKAIFMRRKIRRGAGFAKVPVITADTMRHKMRSASSYALLDAAGLLDAKLSEGALRLLFAGGTITGKGDASSVRLDEYRQLVDTIPPLGLFGGCAGNRPIPGRLQVEDALVIATETERFVPEWAWVWAARHAGGLGSARDCLEEATRVRMDPTLSPEKRKLLTEGAQGDVERRLLASEAASESGDAVEAQASKSTALPRSFECLATGTLFFWAVEARVYNELERDTLDVAVASFLADAVVGGKVATGHGRIRALVGNQIQLARPAEAMDEFDPKAIGTAKGAVFRAHVAERKEALAELLTGVNS